MLLLVGLKQLTAVLTHVHPSVLLRSLRSMCAAGVSVIPRSLFYRDFGFPLFCVWFLQRIALQVDELRRIAQCAVPSETTQNGKKKPWPLTRVVAALHAATSEGPVADPYIDTLRSRIIENVFTYATPKA